MGSERVNEIRERSEDGYWWCDNKIEDANRDVAFLLAENERLQAAIDAVRPLVNAERRQLSSTQLTAWEAGEGE